MKKKINYETASKIMCYKKSHFFQKYFCNWTVEQTQDGYHIQCNIKPLIFILLFIPTNIIQLGYNILFEGILKGPYFINPEVTQSYIAKWTVSADKIEEAKIFEK